MFILNILSTQTLPHFHEFAYKYSTVFIYRGSRPEVLCKKGFLEILQNLC